MVGATLPRVRQPPPTVVVQVFGRDDSRETRAAIRFFRERRIEPQVIDLGRKPIASGELRRFVERLGARALADTAGRSWLDAGFGYLSMTDADLVDRLLADQRLLRLPLVRVANGVAAGPDEPRWRALLTEAST
jgi:arsenate reductase-like glutaredoxin family protein